MFIAQQCRTGTCTVGLSRDRKALSFAAFCLIIFLVAKVLLVSSKCSWSSWSCKADTGGQWAIRAFYVPIVIFLGFLSSVLLFPLSRLFILESFSHLHLLLFSVDLSFFFFSFHSLFARQLMSKDQQISIIGKKNWHEIVTGRLLFLLLFLFLSLFGQRPQRADVL